MRILFYKKKKKKNKRHKRKQEVAIFYEIMWSENEVF
jgi:hypothetical protein